MPSFRLAFLWPIHKMHALILWISSLFDQQRKQTSSKEVLTSKVITYISKEMGEDIFCKWVIHFKVIYQTPKNPGGWLL